MLDKNLPGSVEYFSYTFRCLDQIVLRIGKTFKDLKFIYKKIRIKDNVKADLFLKFWQDIGCEMIELAPRGT